MPRLEVSGQAQRVSDQIQWARDGGLPHPSEDFSYSFPKQFRSLIDRSTSGLSIQNVDYVVLLYALSGILLFKFPSQRPIFLCLIFTFLRPIVLPWITHFYPNGLLFLVIYESCVHSVLRQCSCSASTGTFPYAFASGDFYEYFGSTDGATSE